MALKLSPAPIGKQTLSVNFDGHVLQTYTYRPAGEIKGVLLNFHGSGRNAEAARDTAMKMADKYGLYVVSPKFDETEFSTRDYQMGGILDSRGQLRPQDDWTVSLVDDIATWAHGKVGNVPGLETIGFGHSAGGQFMSRVAAFGPDIFDKMIIGNPSTHVRASLTEDMPYGFDGLPAAQKEAYLKDYLADPITLYAGSLDNDPNAADLAKGSAAMRQGDDRLERALFTYNEAKALAAEKGWDFNWELVIAKDVAHSGRGLFNAPEWQQAFDGRVDDVPVVTPAPAPAPAPAPVNPPAPKVHDFNRASDWHGTVLKDYKDGDILDFRDIDAQVMTRGNQDFKFLGLVGPGAFTTKGAEIRTRHYDGDTYVYLNTDRDTTYEAKGMIEGIHHLTASDFLL